MMEQWRHNGESFFLIVESCGIVWKTEFIKQLSEVYPHAYIALIMDNAIWHSLKPWIFQTISTLLLFSPDKPGSKSLEHVWVEIHKHGFKNKAFKLLDSAIDKLQEVIQGLHWSVLKIIGNQEGASSAYFD